MRLFLRGPHLLAALCLFALLCPAVARPEFFRNQPAATLTVTTTADNGPGSLRDAIAMASDGDTIQFDAALNGQTISLTSAELAIDKSITINGPGPNLLTVSRSSGTFRIFHVLPGRTVILEGLTIRNGNGNSNSGGGGVLNDHATVNINNCVIRQNSQSPFGRGGGLYNDGSAGSATSTILDTSVSNNAAAGYGGGIYNDAHNAGSVTLSLMNSSVNGNSAADYTDFFGDGRGGGIYSDGAGVNITITNSSVSNNTAGDHGSFNFPFGYGGGIYGNGTVTISNSTINGNSVGQSGGGISNYGTMTITNSTVSSNSAFGTHDGMNWTCYGGGIENNGTLTITNSTFSGNTANNGGIYNSNGRTFELGNTILKAGASGANIGGTVTSHGYNLSSDNGGGFLTGPGDQINTNPMLGPLQNNGGPTFTHQPLNGSPAIDAGDPSFTPPPLYDQRGFGYARVYNGRIDIGSLEVQPAPTPTPTPMPGISGVVIYCTNPALNPVPGVTMTLTGTSGGSTTTGAAGNYSFTGLIYGGNYTVTPTKTALSPGSPNISTVDVIATQRHFLNLGTPLSGCRLAAADVNGDSSVNTVDVVAIQRFFLGLSTGIDNVGKYQFTPANRTYTELGTSQFGQNYDTLVFGDVVAPFAE